MQETVINTAPLHILNPGCSQSVPDNGKEKEKKHTPQISSVLDKGRNRGMGDRGMVAPNAFQQRLHVCLNSGNVSISLIAIQPLQL